MWEDSLLPGAPDCNKEGPTRRDKGCKNERVYISEAKSEIYTLFLV